MASFGPIEDVQSVLEQFIENVSNLPAELTHLYEELSNKDKRVHALKQSIAQKDASIQRFIRQNGSQTIYPKEAAYNKAIGEAFKEIGVIQDEKCKLAKRATELIDKHVKRLDMKIRDLQREGLISEDFITPQMLSQYAPPNLSGPSSSNNSGNSNNSSSGGSITTNALPGRLPPSHAGSRAGGGSSVGSGNSTASTLENVSRTLAASAEDQLLHTLKGILPSGAPDPKRRRLNTGGPAPVGPSPLANASNANSGVNTPTRGLSSLSQGQAPARRSGPPPKPVRRPTANTAPKKQKNEDDVDEDHSDSDNDEEEEDTGEDQKPYCVCQQVSFGNMVACDNKSCPFEWFHWGCVGLTKEPAGSWFCDHCTKLRNKGVKKE
ncbi:Histone acetyltransferase complex subunit [Orbilia blumenaviensis]|uniref:Chromatin modification-related protein n=1 Tax=Orbilia blumenaviensis TaxID=1796055 RepID=A0AAV9UGN2_9PEZI